MQEREIWFRREMGWSTPCHWKGWAATFMGMIAMAPFIFGMNIAFDRLPEPWAGLVGLVHLMGMGFAFYIWWRWTERHTESRPAR